VCPKCSKTYKKDRGFRHRDGLCVNNSVDETPIIAQNLSTGVNLPRNPYENLVQKIEDKRKELAILEAKKKEFDSLFE
jgi:hypothetical protein